MTKPSETNPFREARAVQCGDKRLADVPEAMRGAVKDLIQNRKASLVEYAENLRSPRRFLGRGAPLREVR